MTESKTTENLIQEYLASIEAVKMSEMELNRNQTDRLNRKNALGKHLVPKDAKHGEKFVIWVHDQNDQERLLVLEVSADTYIISWR